MWNIISLIIKYYMLYLHTSKIRIICDIILTDKIVQTKILICLVKIYISSMEWVGSIWHCNELDLIEKEREREREKERN